ncbi:MAG TPA: MmcQ/YjbR family DNA-binding protein [Actinomycetaceae bacterium]|nr:MmcQ/YjbR family DNA-binding protein [Actinomycetaceae bacterium]
MPHPPMFADDDPYLGRLRPLALAFPDAVEAVAHGRPTFRVQKMFAVYGGGTKGDRATRRDYPHGLLLVPDPEERAALAADPRVFVPAYYGPYGWLGLDLATAPPGEVDRQEVAELLDSSYRQVATARQVALLDAGHGPAGAPRPGGDLPAGPRR